MDGAEFKAILRYLGKTQVKFAEELGVALRTVHYWASKGPPSEISYLLNLMIVHEMPFDSMADRKTDVVNQIIKLELNRLLAAAGEHRRGEVLRIIDEWISENIAPHNTES